MKKIELKEISYKGISLKVPEIWTAETETYIEPDGRECVMIDISAAEGDPRSIIISYCPMPEGSDAYMEAGGTYEEIMNEFAPENDEDPVCEYDFLGKVAFGFEFPTEDNMACNFICAEVGGENEGECKLLTVLTTARTFEEIDDLLDLIEENISL